MRKKKLFILLAVVALAFTGGAATAGVIYIKDGNNQMIPNEVSSKLNFNPFLANGSNELKVDQATVKYDYSEKGLSFIASSSEAGALTVSQQATPTDFIDIPDYYTKMVDGLNRYGVFQNQLGTVYLTKPKDQQSGQTAVMNSGGVLIFVRSDKDLNDDQWNLIFNNLQQSK